MSLVSKCLVVVPVCAALSVASGYARAEKPTVDRNARSHAESFVTGSIGITEARGAVAQPTAVRTSTRSEDRSSAGRAKQPASPHRMTDPELQVAPLDNYRLELDNCCGPEEE